jgi:hypothetical protein
VKVGVCVQPGGEVGVVVGAVVVQDHVVQDHVVQDHVDLQSPGDPAVYGRRNFTNSPLRCVGGHWPITTPVNTFNAAKRAVVPSRVSSWVIVPAPLLLHRQGRLGAIKCLDLTLLFHTQR